MMLVLTRKKHETIEVGSTITIRVVQIKGNKVRIGVEAPAECSIRRGEVVERDLLLERVEAQTECSPDRA